MEMNLDFGFGYNDSNFSDRILRILILSDDKSTSGSHSDENEEYEIPPCDGQIQNSKGVEASDKNDKILEDGETSKKKEAFCKRDDKPISGSKPDEHEDCRKPVCDDQLPNSNEVFVQIKSRVMIQTNWVWRIAVLSTKKVKMMLGTSLGIDMGLNQPGYEASQQNQTSSEVHCSEFQQKCVWVSSLILAAHSPFFHKLFSNGMKESGQQHATIHIQASEEDAFMDLLKFMYSGKLLRDTPSGLRDVIMAADKFSVASCMKMCGQLLSNLPMTIELALLYLDLDLNGLMMDSVGPHLDTAKQFLVEHFKHINNAELQEELLKLPLVGVEAVLASDHLRTNSEDDIYDFMLRWVQRNYSDHLEERRTMTTTLVHRFLRFPFLSPEKLVSTITCRDIDPAVASELALGALCSLKAQSPYQQTPNIVKRRAYTKLPLKAVVVDNSSSDLHSIVYIDLTRDECENFLPQVIVQSHMFFVGEHQLSLGFCHSLDYFRLYYCASRSQTSKTTFTIACDLASMDLSSKEFVRRSKRNFNMTEGSDSSLWWNIFEVSWSTFIGNNSPFFMNNVLLLRCDLTIKN